MSTPDFDKKEWSRCVFGSGNEARRVKTERLNGLLDRLSKERRNENEEER